MATTATIAILGHDGHGKTTLAQALAEQGAPFAVADPVDWTTASQWSGAILVVSAPDGLMPGTRDDVIRAVRQGVSRIVVYLSKVDQVPEEELLELITMETGELIAKHGPKSGAPVVRTVAEVIAAARGFAR